MVCDDYFDNITPGETWKANGVSAGSLTASTGEIIGNVAVSCTLTLVANGSDQHIGVTDFAELNTLHLAV